MYGIPDFKLEKWRVWRRIEQMREEGVEFRCGVNVGADISTQSLTQEYDAVVLTGGATLGRDLPLPGRNHFSVCDALAETGHPLHDITLDLLGVARPRS